ncbi:MAG TPA: preprotein translocase subunit SecE [Candidatus Saccharibacteria bacterium]|nr:preprotein translocase subunit SecE [Candidatus Saccharibacteria bacterium]
MSKEKSKNVKSQSLRQNIESNAGSSKKNRRLKTGASTVSKPLKKVIGKGKNEYHIPLPDNKAGRILGKRVRIFPKYFRDSWAELRQVVWPDRKQTIKLTTAVIVFALVFGVAVAIVDYGLDKLFRILILEK